MSRQQPAPEAPELEEPIRRAVTGSGLDLPGGAPQGLIRALALHLALTLRWNRSMSLTAVTDPEEAIRLHVLEGLQAALHIRPGAGALLDIGSGNGYPALPALMAHPGLQATLLEPALRKSVFLETVARAAGLSGVEVRRERVDHPSDLERYPGTGTILMRAVKVVEQVVDGAARHLPPGGRVILPLSAARAASIAGACPPGLRLAARESLPGRRHATLLVLERR